MYLVANRNSFHYRQVGFTLVEIAIVLVIIGLLLGGVIKGRELIFHAEIKSTIDEMHQFVAAIYAYEDKYGALPGDDPKAKTNLASSIGGCAADDINNGNGDGKMDEYWKSIQHLACANYVVGSYNGVDQTIHSRWGTKILLFYDWHKKANGIRYYGLRAKVAAAIDKSMDDGIYNTGSVRGSSVYTTTNAVDLTYLY